MTHRAFLTSACTFAAIAGICGSRTVSATPAYPTTNSVSITETGLIITSNSNGKLFIPPYRRRIVVR